MLKKGAYISDRYRINALIGTGSTSLVYHADDIKQNREVAVKILKQDMASNRFDNILRFQREANLVATLDHPSLVRLYETGEHAGRHYIVTEVLAGQSLKNCLRSGHNFELADTLHIAIELTEALKYVHAAGVVHRDLKPGNIFLAKPANGKHQANIKLLDFGLAQIIELSNMSNSVEVVGTFGYMSPEQSGIIKKPVDERSDFYSLGIIIYQLLTGQIPFTGENVTTVLHQQIAKAPAPLTAVDQRIPYGLEQIVMKLLKKDPAERYQSAAGLLTDLKKVSEGEASFVPGLHDRTDKLNYRTSLIGREEEFDGIKQLYEKVFTGRGSVCLISGEAGAGKSRLVEEIRRDVFECGGEFIGGKCLAQSIRTPYQPFAEALNEYLNELNKLGLAQKNSMLQKMKNSFGDLAEIICRINPAIKEILGDVPPLVNLDPEKEKVRFLMVCAKFFLGLGEPGRPMVIMLEDLHWADEGTLVLIQEMLEAVEQSAVLVLGTYRHDEITESHGLHNIIELAKTKRYPLTEVKLSNFDLARTQLFLGKIMFEENSRHTRELSKFIFEKSQGNPLFILEIVRQLVENKALIFEQGQFRPKWRKIKTLTIPSTIVDVIIKRIKDLTEDQMRLLNYGAMIGKDFDIELLAYVSKTSMAAVINLIDELIAVQLLERSSNKTKIVFVHDRVRDAFYEGIDPGERRRLHLEVGNAIELLYNENLGQHVFELAYHYTVAEQKAKSLEYSLRAAYEAKRGFSNEEAIKHFQIAIDLLDAGKRGTPRWISAKEGLMEVHLTTGDNDKVIEIAQELLPLKYTSLEKAAVYRQIGAAYFRQGDLVKGEDYILQGLNLLGEKVPRDRTLVKLSLIRELVVHLLHIVFPGIFLHKEGELVNPRYLEISYNSLILNWRYIYANLEKVAWSVIRKLNLIEAKVGKSEVLARCTGQYGSLCSAIPLFGRAIASLEQAVEMSRELRDEWGLAQCLRWLGFCYLWKAEYQRSVEYLKESVDIFDRLGDLWEKGQSVQGLGYAYDCLADYANCEECFFSYYEISKKLKNTYGLGIIMPHIASLYTKQGDFQRANEWLTKAFGFSEKAQLREGIFQAYLHQGNFLIRLGEYNQSIESLEKAKAIYEDGAGGQALKEYIVKVYTYLAEAYIGRYQVNSTTWSSSELKQELRKIKQATDNAAKKTKAWPNQFGGTLRVLGKYFALIGDNKKAERYFLESIAHCQNISNQYELGKGWYEYGCYLNATNREHPGRENWQKAYNLFRKIGAKACCDTTKKLLGIKEYPHKIESTGPHEGVYKALIEKFGVSFINNASNYLSTIKDITQLLEKIMDISMELSGAARGCLLLYSEQVSGEVTPEFKVRRAMENGQRTTRKFSMSRTVIRRVEETLEPVLVHDAVTEDDLGHQRSVIIQGLRSILCLPLVVKNKLQGILYLENSLVGGVFTTDKLDLLNTFAIQGAMAIENTLLREQLLDVENKQANRSQMSKSRSENGIEQFVSSHELTSREKQVLGLLLEGHSNTIIEERLNITASTTKTHLRNIYGKLLVSNRKELFAKFIEFSNSQG